MRNLINTLVAAIVITVFASCEKEPTQETADSITIKRSKIERLVKSKPADEKDMQAFIEHISRHVSLSRNIYCFYNNEYHDKLPRLTNWNKFALFDDNTGMLCISEKSPLDKNLLTWKIDESDPMSIILTAEWMNEPEKYLYEPERYLNNPNKYIFVNNTKITLLYFKDHTAILKGLQPFYYVDYSDLDTSQYVIDPNSDYIISEEYCMPDFFDLQKMKQMYLGIDIEIDHEIIQ